VAEGIEGGEQIVTSANFLIDSESQLQAALDHSFRSTGAGAAISHKCPSSERRFNFEPNPPNKEATFPHKITDASGSPISGRVSVTFFMPAMQQWNGAMRTPIALSDKGNGVYEVQGIGAANVQTTILAKKNGQTIASKQLRRERYREECSVIARWIDWSCGNRFLVFHGTLLLVLAVNLGVAENSARCLAEYFRRRVIIHTPWNG